MTTIQFEIPNELAHDVAPYRDRLSDLLALGLRVWKQTEQNNPADELEALLQKLGEDHRVILPMPTVPSESAPERTEPLSIPGPSVSDVVIEQRGPK